MKCWQINDCTYKRHNFMVQWNLFWSTQYVLEVIVPCQISLSACKLDQTPPLSVTKRKACVGAWLFMEHYFVWLRWFITCAFNWCIFTCSTSLIVNNLVIMLCGSALCAVNRFCWFKTSLSSRFLSSKAASLSVLTTIYLNAHKF